MVSSGDPAWWWQTPRVLMPVLNVHPACVALLVKSFRAVRSKLSESRSHNLCRTDQMQCRSPYHRDMLAEQLHQVPDKYS